MEQHERLGEAQKIRLYLHTTRQRAFIRERLHPLLADFSRQHLLPVRLMRRGWLHGPHVELVVRPHGGRTCDVAELAPRLAGAVHGITPEPVDEDAYLRRAGQLGRMENVPGPYLPVHAHGTVDVPAMGDDDRWPRPLGDVRDAVLTALTDAACAETEPDAARRRTRLAAVMAALAASSPVGLGLGAMSYRSHSEAFFALSPHTDVRAAFTRRFEQEGDAFREVVRRQLSSGTPTDLRPWTSAFTYGWGALDALGSAGVLTAETVAAISADQAGRATARPKTHFHRTFDDLGLLDRPAHWFLAYRCLLNFLYTALPLLDVTPVERYYLCFALSEALDQETGSTWEQRLDDVRDELTGG
ncbi:hypothetical protein BLA24_06530 [Streptomyces cinnamoneus]|uniref:Uncharacterized protein n=1 Tax=Streptomyces cinnamoneus TaxID=53446 RepID=A0A2G1XMJ1_STRCJ|nr:hypothetical protein [Streptomyces cinnamoneus]PHQ52436.1 hypothetical protein BLA24_06530 [Streptomyces cinnamoneus]PPT15968.1 hypothetical protein CYQ11_26680 [Streptomyces cinnamoneus]